MAEVITIKKYSNRRLYDTDRSRYITLEELAETIRGGAEVRVVDAGSGGDLTQATLAQIVIESRGAARLLPVPLLVEMIRMGDSALAEFLGRYVGWAFGVYSQVRRQGQALGGLNPFALPLGQAPWGGWSWPGQAAPRRHGAAASPAPSPAQAATGSAPPPNPQQPPQGGPDPREEIAALRDELAALRAAIEGAG